MIAVELIEKIYASGVVRKVCRGLCGEYADDVEQEIYLYFLKIQPDKLKEIYEGAFDYYVFRMVMTFKNPQSKMHRDLTDPRIHVWDHDNLRNYCEQINSITRFDVEDDILNCMSLDAVNKKIDEMYWYDRVLFKTYLKEGSYRAVEKETGINYQSVRKTVKKVRKQLKKEIHEHSTINRD